MKLSRPRMSVGGKPTPEEINKYLFKLVDETEALIEEIRKKSDTDREYLTKLIADNHEVPAKVLEIVEALNANYEDLLKQVQRNANNIVNLQIWKEDFLVGYNSELNYIHSRLDAISK